MKHLRFIIATTTVVFFIVGFSIGFSALRLTENYIGRKTIGSTLWESLTPNLSLGFLLAFCSISAGSILWSYLKTKITYPPSLVFTSELLIAIVSAAISIWLRLWQIRTLESQFLDYGNIQLNVKGINYFSWGFGPVFFVSGIITILFLWISQSREKQTNIDSTVQNKNRMLSTIVSIVFLILGSVYFVSFLCRMISIGFY